MSRSIRKETSSLAFGTVGRLRGSSAGFVVAALNATSAASREVVVLRVLSAGILCPRAELHFLKTNWVMMRWITLGEPSGPDGSLPIRCKLIADVGASSIVGREESFAVTGFGEAGRPRGRGKGSTRGRVKAPRTSAGAG